MTQLVEFKNKQGEILRGLYEHASGSVGVLFVHGFERTTVEPKYKNFIEALRKKTSTFRFDFSGNGLSDGNFATGSFEKWEQEVNAAFVQLQKLNPRLKTIHVVSHSVGACISVSLKKKKQLGKMVFLSPAWNQKSLLRYWFVRSQNKDKIISWKNFESFLDEKAFQKDLLQKKRMTKAHFLGPQYHRIAAKTDFQEQLVDMDASSLLVVHGDMDVSVPLESNHFLSQTIKTVVVKNGDHDLERPDMVAQYLKKVVRFLAL